MRRFVKTDAKDRQLLPLLRDNARISLAAIARALGVVRTTAAARLKRLEDAGIIAGYTVLSNAQEDERLLTVHVLISVDPKRAESVFKILRAIPQVRGLYAISGRFDCLIFVEGESTAEIDEVLDSIGGLAGVDKTLSSLILAVKFDRHRLIS